MKWTLPLLLLSIGCTAPAPDDGAEPDTLAGADGKADWVGTRGFAHPLLPENMIPVPLVAQKTDYSCGDASALAILRYWLNDTWKQRPETDLYKPLGTTSKDGTDPRPIATFLAGQAGLSADYVSGEADVTTDDLEAAIDGGDPTIVDIEAWQAVAHAQDMKPWATDWIDGHYVVLTGYDADNYYFMDPSTTGRYAYIPKAQFAKRWHDVLGTSQHVQHMTIFVHGGTTPFQPPHALPPRATIIN
jgi:predicted double-glycine peptidase